MRLLFFGDMTGTGFGTVTKDLGTAFVKAGVDVRFLSLNEVDGELDEPFKGRSALLGDGWLGMEDPAQTYERLRGMYTGSLFEDGWTPDQALVIGDVASLKISPLVEIPRPKGFRIWHYVPIEGVGLPPAWAALWHPDALGFLPVACSEFGADQIASLGVPRPPVIYHGIDPKAFHPVSAKRPIFLHNGKKMTLLRSKEDCRRLLGWPERDVILFRADRHMPRKTYGAMFRCVAPVLARHQNVRLIWHCRTLDQGGDLADERSKYPPHIANRMQSTGFHDQVGGVDRKILCAMYNAADIYLSTSAEGFGLTIAESLACGTPALGLNYSSVPEVIGPAGVTSRAVLVDNIYSHFWATPHEPAYTEALEGLLNNPAERMVMGAKGPYHTEKFRWTAEPWLALMGESEAVAA